MARTKHVFPTDEIAHLWAHKTQDDARNPGGNFYFRGDTIYSYGSHFPIARHVTNDKGEAAVLFTNQKWSNTTAKHINYVRRSIPDGVPVFYVEDLSRDSGRDPKNAYDSQRKDVEALIKRLQGTRPDNRYEYKVKTSKVKFNALVGRDKEASEVDAVAGRNVVAHKGNTNWRDNGYWTLAVRNGVNAGTTIQSGLSKTEARIMLDILDSIKTWDVSTAEKRDRLYKKVAKAHEVAKEFGSISRNPGTLAKLYTKLRTKVYAVNSIGDFFGYGPAVEIPADLDYLNDVMVAHDATVAAARLKGRATRDTRWARQQENERKTFEERLPLWLAGESVSLPSQYMTGTSYLRVKDNEVQTSQGARVPLEHVKKALPVVLAYVQNGREYHRNGHTIHLGHYAIDSIDTQGNLRAGCHLFNKAEIERFAGVLEALPNNPPVAVTYAPPGIDPRVVARFNTLKEAEDWIESESASDPAGVARGDYGIDAPELMVNPLPDPQTNDALSVTGQENA